MNHQCSSEHQQEEEFQSSPMHLFPKESVPPESRDTTRRGGAAGVSVTGEKPAPPPRFTTPKTDGAVEEAKKSGVPKKTQTDTLWCINLWKAWRESRNKIYNSRNWT